ncbi:glycine betaine ABC transporter substrate-binding protein [Pelagibius sp. Alg239-R121]|uniref:glycine betaine ABC transporter substrate-binding protein n=1 Tax=Pelagibius sp. Alg239-R121 TaxID=2993448 RepID=UPI0024A730D8|nr:glycine betaine ABC transporter substrate-binding protein [Pelagibius sp. Alg239-R121]
MFRSLLIAVLAFTLSACGDSEGQIKIGAKNFGESRILAHMLAELASAQGLPVAGVVDYPSTQAIQAALKQGDIDAYPEYNGTGLVMLGQNPTADGDAATKRVKELYDPLGLSWRPRIGFANNYGLAMRPDRAAELGLTSMSQLVAQAASLNVGIEDDFIKRPLDGFQPMAQRYGYNFGSTDIVPLSDRAQLYDKLLDGQVDLIEVYTSDGQIADYGLVLLEDDLQFFPVYQAAILASAASLANHNGLGGAFDALAGKIDIETMRDLNRKVDIEGRSPRAVARDALARLGLIDSGAVEADDPLFIAASPFVSEGVAANAALRAARSAFQGRNVQILPSHAPLEMVANGEARLALVASDAFFDVTKPTPVRNESFEAVAVIGQNLVHMVTAQGGPADLSSITRIGTGPDGSASHRLATVLASGLSLSAEVVPGEVENTAALLAKLTDGSADAALVSAPEGDSALLASFADTSFRLLPIEGWNEGANLVRFPFIRQNRISKLVYRGQFHPVETLGEQLVLAGPAPDTAAIVGDQGPSAIAVGLSPISGNAVMALNEAVSGATLIDPTLKQAAALAPVLPEPPAAINPASDVSILSLLVVAMFVWMVWLYIRPEYR